MYRFFDRSRENLSRGGARDFGRDSLGLRDGSEMVVSDACVKGKSFIIFVKLFVNFLCCLCLSLFLFEAFPPCCMSFSFCFPDKSFYAFNISQKFLFSESILGERKRHHHHHHHSKSGNRSSSEFRDQNLGAGGNRTRHYWHRMVITINLDE